MGTEHIINVGVTQAKLQARKEMRLRGRVGCHYILPELFWRNFINQLIAFSFNNLKSPLFCACKNFFIIFISEVVREICQKLVLFSWWISVYVMGTV